MKAFIFPGQGSQALGMGRALAEAYPAAREVFEQVDDALGEKLSSIMWGEDGEKLTLTANAQPALMAVSCAVARVLEAEGKPLAELGKFAAGHSLGEYSALIAVGALKLDDGAKLLRLRGEAMQEAVPLGKGAMAALLGLEFEAVAEFMQKIEGATIANDNAIGQIVISGTKEAVAQAVELAKEKGAKRAMMLDVSAPFHCPLMKPAADKMQAALADINFAEPQLPIVENMLAAPTQDKEALRTLLVEQITGCVRWRESITFMAAEGVAEFYEIGTGKVLSGMIKRIVKEASGVSVGSKEEIEKFLTDNK